MSITFPAETYVLRYQSILSKPADASIRESEALGHKEGERSMAPETRIVNDPNAEPAVRPVIHTDRGQGSPALRVLARARAWGFDGGGEVLSWRFQRPASTHALG